MLVRRKEDNGDGCIQRQAERTDFLHIILNATEQQLHLLLMTSRQHFSRRNTPGRQTQERSLFDEAGKALGHLFIGMKDSTFYLFHTHKDRYFSRSLYLHPFY